MAQDYVEIVHQLITTSTGAGTKNIFNIYQYRRSSGAGVPNKTNIHDQWHASVASPVLAALNEKTTEVATTIRYFDDAMDAPFSVADIGNGAITGDPMDTFVSAVIQLKSATKGKFARGSKHYAQMSESDSDGDIWNAGCLGRLATIKTALITPFTDADGNTWVPVVKSGKLPAQYKVNPVTVVTYDIVSGKVNKTAGPMRRRKCRTVTA